MSAHEQDRLSAYLDGELPAPERAAVAAHLAGCSECEEQLAALAGVDEATRQLELQAPEGYFDTFAARVRGRIEPAPASGRGARRLPVWAWAAAAALLLAVVTPLTLRERAVGARPAATRQAAAPVVQVPASPQAPADFAVVREVAPAAKPVPRSEARLGAGATAARQDEAAAVNEVRENETAERDARAAPALSAAPAADAIQPRSADLATESAPAPAGAAQEAVVGLDAGASKAETPRTASVARRGTLLKAPAAAGAGAGAAAEGSREEGEAWFARLAAIEPGSAVEWRGLRDAWSAFAAADPAGRRADEARVRAVGAGCEAWRASGLERDGAACRQALSDYLDRPDAAQKARARALADWPGGRRP